MPQQCNLSRMYTESTQRHRPSHVTLLFLTQHENEGYSTVSVLFPSLCTKDLEPRCAAPCSSRMCTTVPTLLCCLISMSCSTLLSSQYRNGKYTPNGTVSVLLKPPCTLHVKSKGDAEWSNCVQIHIVHRKQNFIDTKVWIVKNMHN